MIANKSYFDSSGTTIHLGKRIASGGEGDIYEVPNSQFVAKIYKSKITEDKGVKLRAMVDQCDDDLRKIAAWPSKLIFDSQKGISGFIMDRVIDYKPFYDLCNPAARKKHFHDKDYLFLLFCARNIILAFRIIHSKKIVVGDVNESNLVVSEKGLIKFIDCDSFQINYDNILHPCEVGVPLYTPPELHSIVLSKVQRTENHDVFGMAVLCFQLLFMGRHPYVGIYDGPEIPFEKEIQQFRFAYGKIGRLKGIKPPGGSLSFESISPGLQILFEQAFSEKGVSGRPSLVKWYDELDNLIKHVSICSKDNVHKYYSLLKECPWCVLEDNKGLYFFIKSKLSSIGFDRFSFDSLRTQLMNITISPDDTNFSPSSFKINANSEKESLRLLVRISKMQKFIAWTIPFLALFISGKAFFLSILLAIVVYNIGFVHSKINKERKILNLILNEKNNTFQYLLKQWNEETSLVGFNNLKSRLDHLVYKYQNLPRDYAAEKRKLYDDRELHQLQDFLSKFYIRSYSIPYIKEARKITLRSFGVETAADTLKMNVPGFGPFLTGELTSWRKALEKKFKFDPTKDIDDQHLNNLNQKFDKLRSGYDKEISGGIEDLRKIKTKVLAARTNLKNAVSKAAQDYYQEEANFNFVFK